MEIRKRIKIIQTNKIGQNIQKSSGTLRRFAVTQSKLMFKNLQGVKL